MFYVLLDYYFDELIEPIALFEPSYDDLIIRPHSIVMSGKMQYFCRNRIAHNELKRDAAPLESHDENRFYANLNLAY